MSSNSTSGIHRFTPPSPPSSTSSDSYDPDLPLPSVEGDASSTNERESSPIIDLHTTSASTLEASPLQVSHQRGVLQPIGGIQNLRLSSPRTPERATPTPSIHVTPSAPPNGSSLPRANRTDSLVNDVAGLHIASLQPDSSDATRLRESRSPSLPRRRRSGSGINKDIHKIENEDPPEASFYMPEVQGALANARALTSTMADVLSSSTLHREMGSSIASLYEQAQKLNNFQLPSSRIVGLVGDSGAGKSSLINSLLDKMELARASSSGTACTCAVTEYRFHDRDNYIIHVDYFPLNELKKQYEELLMAFRDYESLSKKLNAEQENGNEDENERKRLRETANLAIETFRASFREKLEETPTVLSSMPFPQAVKTMVEWASELLPRSMGQESFRTVEECSSRLVTLTSDSDGTLPNEGSRARWPFIQKLRVYLNAYILSKGLIIADLPGLRDLNSARKAITERYVRQCHQILVVAKIDRAITDESIKEIFDLASRVNLSKIDVICTRSEEIQTREARHDWPAERATIEESQRVIDDDTAEIESLTEEIEEYEEDLANLTREDEKQLMRLQQDRRKAVTSREHHKFELLCHIVKLRNNKVSKGLREAYSAHPIAKELKIFCVSNKMYWDNREKPASAALPYLRFSGIIELRRYCIGIVAHSRLRTTKDFIKNQIPAFLGSVRLWIEAGTGNASAESKQRILDAIAAMQLEIDELMSVDSQFQNLSRTLSERFNSEMYLRMTQSGPQWSIDAKRISLCWQGLHHSSYKAFCSHYGKHTPRGQGLQCWNEEVMASVNIEFAPVWDNFLSNIEAHFKQLNDAVVRALGNVLKVASSTCTNEVVTTDNTRSAMRTFAATLRHRKDLILYGIETAIESFHSELSSLHTDTFSSARTAFIGKIMEDSYHAANMEYGTGSDRRRKDLITGRVGSRSLFETHRRDCRKEFKRITRQLEDEANQVTNQQVALIEADLQMLRDENAVLESERDPEFRRRVMTEIERVTRAVNEILPIFENV